MKIALLQINTRLADPEANSKAIENAYLEAVRHGADLAVSPELAVFGCIPDDKLLDPRLIRRIEAESGRLQSVAGSVPLVFGTCKPTDAGKLWNEVWWCEKGERRVRIRKTLISGFDAYNECRYFESEADQQKPIEYRDEKIAFAIGENLCCSFEHLIQAGATLVIVVAASTCALGSYAPQGNNPSWAMPSKQARRRYYLLRQSKACAAPIAYINSVGANGSLLFDGGSCLVTPDETRQRGEEFQDGVFIVDTKEQGTAWPEISNDDEGSWLRGALALGVKDNLVKQGIEAVVVGLSGGIDSAVVAALALDAIGPEKILGVALPTRYTSAKSVELAKLQAQRLGVNYLQLDADAPYVGAASSLLCALPGRQFGLTDENLQSRCRCMLLMALTTETAIHQLLGTDRCVVLNTGNKSEVATGYFTLYGDAIGAFCPIGDLLKARVYALAREFGDFIPPQVINRPPTAELRPNQTDESSLIPYRQLDAILSALLEANRPMESMYDDLAEVLDGQNLLEARNALPRVQSLINGSEFKRRQLPFAIRVT